MFAKKKIYKSMSILVCSLTLLTATLLFWPTDQVHADPIAEVEPNDDSGTAQTLSMIGRENYVTAATNIASDNDWYKFTATAGQTYVIEIFEASASLNPGFGSICGFNEKGLGIRVYDSSITEIAISCRPVGAGNVHNIVQFTTGVDGEFYIRVFPNNGIITGDYKLRVLYQYDNSSASWDGNYEPNNRLMNAASIQVGRENAITSTIEQRIVNYSTNFVDVDWYHFEAEANKTYVVELFNADVSFNAASGNNCPGFVPGSGISLFIHDDSGTAITSSCRPNTTNAGAGNVHNIVQFTPGLAGTYFIQVLPNANTHNGNYQLRVLHPYDDPLASWDVTHEPNNRLMNAAPIQIGQESAINATIEQQIVNYATHFVDVDWYHFEAEANKTYVVELFNADVSFNAASGNNCPGFVPGSGISLFIHDDSGTIITSSCRPNTNYTGSGNVHNIVQFTAGLAGTYFIQVLPNANAPHGNYELRVLPPYDTLLASWDTNYEPNNKAENAYLLQPGQTLNTDIEARSSTYSTNNVDRGLVSIGSRCGSNIHC